MNENRALLRRNFQDFWRSFSINKLGLFGAFLVLSALLAAVCAPLLTPYSPTEVIRDAAGQGLTFAPPSVHAPLGTDDAGRDIWSQLIFGARISLLVGFVAGFIAMFVGSLFGILAGYFGGSIDNMLMRITDILLVIPDLPLMLVLVATLRQMDLHISPTAVLIAVIGLLYWTSTARLIRSQVLTIKERQFVARSRAIGAGHFHIIRKHILPQILPLIVANTVLIISTAILIESGLAFLGLGDPTQPSWGAMLNFAFDRSAVTNGAWWFYLPPGFAIVWVTLGCVLLGNVLEEILNPRLTGHHLEGTQKITATPETEDKIPATTLLSVRHLTTDFILAEKKVAHALEDISFDVKPGQTIGLVGESGCGKTTTLMSIMRILPASGCITAGNIYFKGKDILTLSEREMRRHRWKDMAIIFQGAMNALNPVIKVGDQICEAILLHNLMDREAAEQRVGELLELVGIPLSRRDFYPHVYSGGMRQRAMIAMALACSPELLFADEPTTALDVMIQAQVLELLKLIQKKLGLAIVLVTHDLGVVAEMCDDIVVMYGGKIAEYGPADLVYNQPQHPYTQRLLEAFPDLSRSMADSEGQELATIPGSPPRLSALPPGCRFSPRCHKSIEICMQIAPELADMAAAGARHLAACHLLHGQEVAVL